MMEGIDGSSSVKRLEKRNAYSFLYGKHQEFERQDIRFRWGRYGFRIIRFHWTEFAPAKVIGFHKHAEFEFHFIPRGKGIVTMDDIDHPFGEGMFYLTGPEVEHRQQADPVEGMEELCLHIDIVELDRAADGEWGDETEADEAEECVRRLRELPHKPTVDQFGAMERFMTVYMAWTSNEPGLYTTIKQSIIQILLCSVRAYGHQRTATSIPARDLNGYRIQLAKQFIDANYMQPITLEDVADKIQISGRQLQRILRESGLGSFSDYIETIRLDRVCTSLAENAEPIEKIALAQGFSSANYLYYVFRKRFHMTPGQYRELKRSEVNEHVN
ncbi:MAG: AraC family transcriptional regulator [Paenibacillus sp.]|nr:AraC family transcriptional regulator [Paenibacillus sp.]